MTTSETAEDAPVCVAFPTIMDGLVLRWYRNLAGYDANVELASASRDHVSVHGQIGDLPPGVLDAANRALELLRADHRGQAAAMATHRPARFLSRELVPIERQATDG